MKKSNIKAVVFGAACIGAYISIGYVFSSLVNLSIGTYDNRFFDGKRHARRLDGVFSYTEFSQDGQHLEVIRGRYVHGPFQDKVEYEDKNGDGLVDRIYNSAEQKVDGLILPSILHRTEHYDALRAVFDAADRDYQEQLIRFGVSFITPQNE